jgi:hypothetical protein
LQTYRRLPNFVEISAGTVEKPPIGLTSYVIAEYLFLSRKRIKITISGYILGALVFGLVITGILLVIRNLVGSGLPPGFIVFLDLAHLGLVMVLLMASLYCIILKKKWAKEYL